MERSHAEIQRFYNLSSLPFSEFNFQSNRVLYTRSPLGTTSVKLYSQDYNANSYEFLDDNHESYKVIITCFLRFLSIETMSLPMFLKTRRIMNPFVSEHSSKDQSYIINFNKNQIAESLKKKKYSIGRSRFYLEMDSDPLKPRKLIFELNNFLILMNFGYFLSLLDYVKPEDNEEEEKNLLSRPNILVYRKDYHHNIEEKTMHKNSNILNFINIKKKPPPKQLIVEVIIRHTMACIESNDEENLIAIKANAKIIYTSNDPSIRIHQSLEHNTKISDDPRYNLSNTKLSANIQNLEMFTCSRGDIFDNKPEDYNIWKLEIKKRALIQPSTLEYISEDSSCRCLSSTQTILKQSKITIGATRANLSYKDLLLLKESAGFQSDSMTKIDKEKQKKLGKRENTSSSSEEEAGSMKDLDGDKKKINDQPNDVEADDDDYKDLSVNSEEEIKAPNVYRIIERKEIRSTMIVVSDKLEIVKPYDFLIIVFKEPMVLI